MFQESVPRSTFDRKTWAEFGSELPCPYSDDQLQQVVLRFPQVSVRELREAYVPLCRYIHAARRAKQPAATHPDSASDLTRSAPPPPYVIGITGSVCIGKTTFAGVLRALLMLGSEAPVVEIVSTDGFLFPNAILLERSLMSRKGFPETYDYESLIGFLRAARLQQSGIRAPLYSHRVYDITGETVELRTPVGILILEGLHLLRSAEASAAVAHYLDTTIYLDASEADIQGWFLGRFLKLWGGAHEDASSYFRRYQSLSLEEATALAAKTWREINLVNLREFIEPTRAFADLLFRKNGDHTLQAVTLKRL